MVTSSLSGPTLVGIQRCGEVGANAKGRSSSFADARGIRTAAGKECDRQQCLKSWASHLIGARYSVAFLIQCAHSPPPLRVVSTKQLRAAADGPAPVQTLLDRDCQSRAGPASRLVRDLQGHLTCPPRRVALRISVLRPEWRRDEEEPVHGGADRDPVRRSDTRNIPRLCRRRPRISPVCPGRARASALGDTSNVGRSRGEEVTAADAATLHGFGRVDVGSGPCASHRRFRRVPQRSRPK